MKNEKMNYGHAQKVKQGIAEERKEVRGEKWEVTFEDVLDFDRVRIE